MAIENYYNAMTLKRPTQTVDAYGDTTNTYSTVCTFYGLIGRPSSAQVQQAAQNGVNISGRLYAPVDVGIKPYDVIVDDDGRTFEVRSAPRNAARRGHHIEADLVELRGGVS